MRMKESGKNIITLVVTVFITLFAIEGMLRFFEHKDFSLITEVNNDGYIVHKPNLDREHFDDEVGQKVHIKTNSAGFVGENFSEKKEEGVMRVAVLGDSFTEATQIDYEKSYVYLLNDQLNKLLTAKATSTYKKTEVLNFGLGGIGTADEMKYYSKYVQKYHPDVVVLSFYLGNDVSDNGYYFEHKNALLSSDKADWDVVPQYGSVQNKEFIALKDKIYRMSALARFIDKAVRSVPVLNNVAISLGLYRPPAALDTAGLNLPFWDYYYLDPLDETRKEHLVFSSDLINNFKKQLDSDGVMLVLMLIPEGKTVNQDILGLFKADHPKLKEYNYNPVGMEEKLVGGLKPDVHVLNLRSVMEQQIKKNNIMYNSGIHHFSAEGHVTASRALAEFIVSLF
jgi:hypothetical protein